MGETNILVIIFLIVFLAVSPPVSSSDASVEIVNFNVIQRRSKPSICMSESVISCVYVKINLEVVKQADQITLPDQTILKVKSRNNNSATYQNVLAEAHFVWYGDTVVGKITEPGKIWSIQGCGEECFIWIEHSPKSRYDIAGLPVPGGPIMD